MEHFFCQCQELMENQCDLAIFLPLNLSNYKDRPMEDNKKRIMNRFFQVQISSIMSELLANWEIPIVQAASAAVASLLTSVSSAASDSSAAGVSVASASSVTSASGVGVASSVTSGVASGDGVGVEVGAVKVCLSVILSVLRAFFTTFTSASSSH